MPKYAILEESAIEGGKMCTVRLIPEVESEKDYTEAQTYFVKDGQLAEDVCSAAAWNHENGVKAILAEPKGGEAAEVVAVQAKPFEELPEDVKLNFEK